MSYPNRWCDLRSTFGRSHGSVARIFYHTLRLVDCMIGNLYGAKEGSMHDSRMFAESNFLQHFREKQAPFNQRYYIYGDSGYGRKDLLIKPFS
ncbi:uncharacterized protein LOC129600826 [Paramacrobiotus metropolitanus]|uniref:uncharacterized protein LOC129600826 n=1 Tax=Paramacrobiotus metropolitanus TaxID=2943436 RepID=UPI002445D48E|nr:uncharacterized protein LOC129600826 [Paramacrobiotus metropolitanus]